MTVEIRLRETTGDDLSVFFEQQRDPASTYMAAFTARDPADREAFEAHWAKILCDEQIKKRTILLGEQVVGSVMSFVVNDRREVCYWIDRAFWGRGMATAALGILLTEVDTRPLYARVANDNGASLRVLEKCEFQIVGRSTGFAQARGREIEEVVLELC